MDTITRLGDLTTAHTDQDRRHAALVTAIATYKQLRDPLMLDMALEGVAPPVKYHVKAATAAIDMSSGLAPARPLVQALIAAVDQQSVLGRLGAIRVPTTNAIGTTATGGATAYWIGESVAKPVSSLVFAALSLTPRKLAAQLAVTAELLRFGTNTLNLLERALTSAAATAIDTALLDPANAGITDVKPASITFGLTPIVGTGSIENQIGQALAAISSGSPTRPTLIASVATAARFATLPGLQNVVKVLVSPAAGARIIAVDSDGIVFTDDGGDLRVGQPDIQLDSAPTSPSTAATVMTSAFQRNITVVRLERFVSWAKRGDSVAFVTVA